MKKYLFTVASCAVIAASSAPVSAQSIDYGTMQDLFGEPVTTSATGKPQRASEVPVTMDILTADDIRRSGAVDLPEVLRQVNGIDVIQGSNNSYDVSVRGYNQGFSQRLLVLVNGRQVYLDHYGYTAWSTIPVQLEEIRQIEVVKGPNTALFGFNAVSGVINIVTYNPLYDDESSAGITVGTQDFRKVHYVQSLKLTDKLGVRISAGKRESNVFDSRANGITTLTDTGGRSTLLDPEQESLNIDAMYQVTDNSQIRLELSGSNVEQGDYVVNGSIIASDYETKSAKLSYEVDSDYGLVKANLYHNALNWDTPGSATSPNGLGLDNKVTVAQLEDTIELNADHTLRLQAEYRRNEFSDSNASILPAGASVSYDVYAAGAMWNWVVNDEWTWTNALRVDHLRLEREGAFLAGNTFTNSDYDQNVTEFSYNSGLVWKPTDTDTVRFSTARGLEVPSLLEYGFEANVGDIVRGNPRLDATVVTNYEIAWDKNVDFVNEGLFRAAAFYQQSEDVKSLFARTAGGFVETENIGDSSTYGLELSLDGQLNEHFDWGVGYTFQHVSDDLNNQAANGAQSVPKEYEDSTPSHQAQVKLGYAKGPWEVDSLVFYKSEHKLTAASFQLEKIDSYVGMNARVGYTFDNDITLAVHGMNIQSASTQTSPAPDIERRLFVSLSKKF